jgi:uncharacterized delta-60 repeat protein
MKRLWLIVMLLGLLDSATAVELDPLFNRGAGTDAFAEHAQALPDGRILVAGAFTAYNGEPVSFLMRLNEDGSLDRSFRHEVNAWVRNFVVQPDGRIVVAGSFSSVEGKPRGLIARLLPDGALDESFDVGDGFSEKVVPADPNPPYVFWMALQPDGKVIVTGSFAKYAGRVVNGIVRLNPDGSIDESFHSGRGLDSWGRFVRVLPNGQILLSGWFTSYNGFGCNRLVRLQADGSPDTSFRPYFGDKTAVYSADVLPDGKVIVSGHSKGTTFTRGIARLNPDGSEDPSFVGFTNERTECVLVQPDGKILVSGWFTAANGQARGCIARFNADGTLDETFVANSEFFIWQLSFDGRGRILAAGGFPKIAGQTRRGIVRLSERRAEASPPTIVSAHVNARGLEAVITTEMGREYCLEYCEGAGAAWHSLTPIVSPGGLLSLRDDSDRTPLRIYRVRAE